MSAFVCILDRTGAAVDPRRLLHCAEGLAASGATELSTFHRGPVGIAVRHRRDPAATARHGPLADPGTGAAVAVAGRSTPADGDPGRPAAAFALSTLAAPASRTGENDDLAFLAGLRGAFTLIAADPARGRMRVARDHLGALKVYYHLGPRLLIAATEASAILRHEAVADDPDEGTAARFLGFRFGWTGRSFFRSIRELPPAHRLEVTADRARVDRYWRFPGPPRETGRTPEEDAADFRRLLGEAVARETAGLAPERVALSLSGGLDSTAVAALAPQGIRCFSWTFDEPELGDERHRVAAVSRHLGLPVERVRGDGLHPLAGGVDEFAGRFVSGGSPYLNPFAALKHRLYTAAREAGCLRVLVGDAGDALYAAREYWLRDALLARRHGASEALGSLVATLGRAARRNRFARRSLVRVLPVTGLRTRLRGGGTPWLTPEGRAALPRTVPSPILPHGPWGPRHRHDLVAGARHTELESEEQRLFALAGVERGNPFWSWPLVEWALSLPADRLHRDGRDKVLTRAAFRGRLPPEVLGAGRAGLLGELFLRGLGLARDDLRRMVFLHPRSDWRRFVRAEWLEPYLPGPAPVSESENRPLAFGHTILWRVISYELWHRKRIGGGGSWG